MRFEITNLRLNQENLKNESDLFNDLFKVCLTHPCWWDWSFWACNCPRPRPLPSRASETRCQERPETRCSSCDGCDAYFVLFDSPFSWGRGWCHCRSTWARCCNERTWPSLRDDDGDGAQLEFEKKIYNYMHIYIFFYLRNCKIFYQNLIIAQGCNSILLIYY